MKSMLSFCHKCYVCVCNECNSGYSSSLCGPQIPPSNICLKHLDIHRNHPFGKMKWLKKTFCSRTSLGMEYSLRRERKKKLYKHILSEIFSLAKFDSNDDYRFAHLHGAPYYCNIPLGYLSSRILYWCFLENWLSEIKSILIILSMEF